MCAEVRVGERGGMARRGDAVRNEPGFLSFHKII